MKKKEKKPIEKEVVAQENDTQQEEKENSLDQDDTTQVSQKGKKDKKNTQKEKSLRDVIASRLSLYCVLFFIIPLCILSGMVYTSFMSRNQEMSMTSTRLTGDTLNTMLEAKVKALQSLKTSILKHYYDESPINLLAVQTETDDEVIAYFIGYADGTAYYGDFWEPEPEYDHRDRAWYYGPIEAQGFVCSAPYLDAVTGDIIISMSDLVQEEGKPDGALGVDLYLTTITDSLKANTTTQNGTDYFMLLDTQGNIVHHYNEDYLPTEDSAYNIHQLDEYEEISAALSLPEDTYGKLKDFDGANRFYYINHMENGWTTIYLVKCASVLHTVALTVFGVLLIGLIACALLYILLLRLITSVLDGIQTLSSNVLLMSEKQYHTPIKVTRQDELGKLEKALEKLRQEMVALLATASNNVAANRLANNRLVQDVGLNSTNATEISYATENIGSCMLNQTEAINEIAQETEGVSHDTSKLNEFIKDALCKVDASNGLVSQLNTHLDEVVQQKNQIGVTLARLNTRTHSLCTYAAQMETLNNAVIEWTQLAQSGAVSNTTLTLKVQEIKEQLNDLTQQIVLDIKETTQEVQQVTQFHETQGDKLNEVTLYTTNLLGDSSSVQELLGNMGETIESMDNSTTTIACEMQSISAVAEETTALIEEINAKINMQQSSAEKLFELVDIVAAQCYALDEILKTYRIK